MLIKNEPGYETTANAIAYGLIALALHQDIQAEFINEINTVYAQAAQAGRTKLMYGQDFEALEYIYGIMVSQPTSADIVLSTLPHLATQTAALVLSCKQYETLRLHPGVIPITKMATQPQPITLTPNSTGVCVYLSAPAVHCNPKYWPEPYRSSPNPAMIWCLSHFHTLESALSVYIKPVRIVAMNRPAHMDSAYDRISEMTVSSPMNMMARMLKYRLGATPKHYRLAVLMTWKLKGRSSHAFYSVNCRRACLCRRAGQLMHTWT